MQVCKSMKIQNYPFRGSKAMIFSCYKLCFQLIFISKKNRIRCTFFFLLKTPFQYFLLLLIPDRFPNRQRIKSLFFALGGVQSYGFDFSSFPGEIKGKSTPSFDAFHSTALPCFWQSRQNADHSIFVRLQQHLSYSSGVAEISIDLEGRMCIKQIVVKTSTQEFLDVLVGHFSVQ